MASIVVPGLDLAPSVPSRIVTVDVIDMTEGAPAVGAKIDFILPQDLHSRSDGKVLKAGTTTLELDANGHGEIRVPAYSTATSPEDWVLLVKKHWAPYPYPIRVAPGTTKVSLASLETPMEVSDAMAKFLPTDVALTVTEGAQWAGSATTGGGIINLGLTVPPGGVAWWRGDLAAEENWDDYWRPTDNGIYRLLLSRAYPGTLPPGARTSTWAILKSSANQQVGTQELTFSGREDVWRRQIASNNPLTWTPWKRVDIDANLVSEIAAKFELSANLLDPTQLVEGILVPSTGGIGSHALYYVTGWIPVLPHTTYNASGTERVVEYDLNREVLRTSASSTVFTTGTGTTFVRLNVLRADAGTAHLNRGELLLPFEPFHAELVGVSLPASHVTSWPQTSISEIQGVDRSPNLFDKLRAEPGVIPLGSGQVVPAIDYVVSTPINVKPAVTYAYQGCHRATFFNADGVYLTSKELVAHGTAQASYVTPQNAATVRVSVRRVDMDATQVVQGAVAGPYQGFWVKIPSLIVNGPTPWQDQAATLLDTPGDLATTFDAPTLPSEPTLTASTTADVYSWWETLRAAHPTYLTRTQIGVACDDTPLWAYRMKPPLVPSNVNGSTTTTGKPPKIVILAGTHGAEKAPVHVMYKIAEALCSNPQDPALAALRWNFEIIVVPVANPSSYDANTRKNANGVDINRNYPEGWTQNPDPSSPTYGGPNPLSEPETQALYALMQNEADQAILGVDLHSLHGSEDSKWVGIWVSPVSIGIQRVGAALISRLSRKWRSQHPWITIPQEMLGYSETASSPIGAAGGQMTAIGIPGTTLEIGSTNRMGSTTEPENGSHALTLGMDTIVNFLTLAAHTALTN